MRPGTCLCGLALILAQPASATPPSRLAADLGQVLSLCNALGGGHPLVAPPAELVGPYGTIAVATGRRPCDVSFTLATASMADVHRVVRAWVKARDPGATYRDPRASGGKRAIWAMRSSTLRLEFADEPSRGTLSVTAFPAGR